MTAQVLFIGNTNFTPTYATWNPSDKDATVTLSGGNLTASITTAGSARGAVRSTIGKSAGKWYWEVHVDSLAKDQSIGVANSSFTLTKYVGEDVNSWGYNTSTTTAFLLTNGGGSSVTVLATGSVVGLALDMDAGTITFYKDNVSQGSFSGLTGTIYPAISGELGFTEVTTAKFGATAFTYSPPAGYSGLYT